MTDPKQMPAEDTILHRSFRNGLALPCPRGATAGPKETREKGPKYRPQTSISSGKVFTSFQFVGKP